MVFCQKIMIPTAGTCLIVGLFVYGTHFDSHYPGTGSYALGSLSAAWLLSALLCASTVASYGPYAGDWTRHISPKLPPGRVDSARVVPRRLVRHGWPVHVGRVHLRGVALQHHSRTDSSYVLG
jgi:hypothetical protein